MAIGINTNLLETNIINLAVVVGVLVRLGGGILTEALETREETLRANLLAADKQEEETERKLAELTEKRAAMKDSLENVTLPRLRRALEDKQKTLTAKHESEMLRLETTQAETIRFETEKRIGELAESVRVRALAKSRTILGERLTKNPQYGRVLLDEAIATLSSTSLVS
jgi:F-type H+-transporting ATPase subunit b